MKSPLNLRDNLRNFLMVAFNPDIEWMLPEGDVPYMPNDAPEGTEHTMLHNEAGTFHNFIKNFTKLHQ